MNNISQPSYTLTFKKLFLISIFIIFTVPYSIYVGSGRVSANYSFIFFPILIILLTGSIKKPNNNILLIMLFFGFIFFISLLYQFQFDKYIYRRLASFIIFMTVFSYLFISITDDMVQAFKVAIVAFSVGYSLIKIGDYFLLGGVDLGFGAKGLLGSQRFGFIFILAFWILALYRPSRMSIKILKPVCIFIVILGLMNTFSRSSILALVGSLMIFFYTKIHLKIKLPTFNFILKYLFIFILASFLIWKIFPLQIEFYIERIFYFLLEGGLYNEIIKSDPRDSMGYRIIIFKEIANFVADNPFTGSGFLGCWIMFDNLSCSAHSQYTDILFRTGLFGFSIYIYILFRIGKYLRATNRDLFYGFIAILIYGFFQETFKLSNGAFILSFLAGMTYDKIFNSSLFNNKI